MRRAWRHVQLNANFNQVDLYILSIICTKKPQTQSFVRAVLYKTYAIDRRRTIFVS